MIDNTIIDNLIKVNKYELIDEEILKIKNEKYAIMILTIIVFSQSILYSSESLIATYYTVYLKDKYNASIIISTSHLSVLLIFIMIGIACSMKLFEDIQTIIDNNNKNNINNIENNKYLTYNFNNVLIQSSLIALVIGAISFFAIIPNINLSNNDLYIYIFFIYFIILGFCFGIPFMNLESIKIQMRHPNIIGKLEGATVLILSFFQSIGVLLVGLLWNISYESVFYGCGVIFGLSALCILFIACVESCTPVKRL